MLEVYKDCLEHVWKWTKQFMLGVAVLLPGIIFYAKPILQNDGTVVLCADATIDRISKINSMLDAHIGKIIEMTFSGPEYLTLS